MKVLSNQSTFMLIGGKLAVCQFSVKSQISRSYWAENPISEDQFSP